MRAKRIRAPHGAVKAIVGALRVGEGCVVRPRWVASFRAAGRRMGLRLEAARFWRGGTMLYRLVRRSEEARRAA